MTEASMVIVGGGKAGARAAVAFRENSWKGPVTLISDEALAPYDRPPLSKAAIMEEAEPQPVYLLDEGMMASLEVNFLRGVAATAIDRNAKTLSLADGKNISYDRLLIATGAEPRRLSQAGAERALLLRDLADSAKIRSEFISGKSVAIIGGGFIGLELAASAAKRGCHVTVIEAQPRVLMRGVPPDIAARIAARHAEADVAILTSASIAEIGSDRILLSDGREVPADIVIAGIGAAPRIKLAEEAGLALDNGIACNTYLQTSDSYIFAVGDCCSFPHPVFGNERLRLEAWRNASDQAIVAVENMLGGQKPYEAVPWFWTDQYELNLQIAGLPQQGVSIVQRVPKEGALILCHLDAEGRLVGASGIGQGNSIARDIRLLEMLIGKKAAPDPALLADPAFQLKSLLKP
ncbi:MAG: FAD-dependent oxidoreductase [Aestuariivirga sp.]|nr:FAD-dependent oxidoreductase [Aestuariivirga sp.]